MHSEIYTKHTAALTSSTHCILLHVPCDTITIQIVAFSQVHETFRYTCTFTKRNSAFTLSALHVEPPVPCGTITKQFTASFFLKCNKCLVLNTKGNQGKQSTAFFLFLSSAQSVKVDVCNEVQAKLYLPQVHYMSSHQIHNFSFKCA